MPRRRREKAGTGEGAAQSRRERFVDAYFACNQNGTQACIRMGYAPKGAATQSTRMLKDAWIRAAVEARRAELAEKAALSAETVTQFWGRVARLDVTRIFGDNGRLLPPSQWPEDVRLLADGIDVKEIAGKGEDAEDAYVTKVDFPKKAAVMEQVARHFGMFARDKPGARPEDDAEPPAPVSVTIDFKDARRKPR